MSTKLSLNKVMLGLFLFVLFVAFPPLMAFAVLAIFAVVLTDVMVEIFRNL